MPVRSRMTLQRRGRRVWRGSGSSKVRSMGAKLRWEPAPTLRSCLTLHHVLYARLTRSGQEAGVGCQAQEPAGRLGSILRPEQCRHAWQQGKPCRGDSRVPPKAGPLGSPAKGVRVPCRLIFDYAQVLFVVMEFLWRNGTCLLDRAQCSHHLNSRSRLWWTTYTGRTFRKRWRS